MKEPTQQRPNVGFTIPGAARELQVPEYSIRRAVLLGEVESIAFGGLKRIPPREIDRLRKLFSPSNDANNNEVNKYQDALRHIMQIARDALGVSAALWLSVALVASIVPARASSECKTIAEARVAFPNKHLWWSRAEHGGRCWHDNGPARHSTTRRPVPLTEPAPAPRVSVLWPVLAGAEPPATAALYHAEPMTRYPLLLDIDALTAPGMVDASGNDASADYCCWPPLQADFRERWFAMPATWFFAALGERLGQ